MMNRKLFQDREPPSRDPREAFLQQNVEEAEREMVEARIKYRIALQVLRRYRVPKGQKSKEMRETT